MNSSAHWFLYTEHCVELTAPNNIGQIENNRKKVGLEVTRLHLERIGVKLTKLTKKQADYLGVPLEGPYKPEHYRY